MPHNRARAGLLFLLVLGLFLGCTSRAPEPTPSQVSSPSPSATVRLPLTPVTPLPRGAGSPPTHISIPRLEVDVDVRPIGWAVVTTAAGRTTEWQVLPDAAGHHRGSANPGEVGNVVISGHNTPGGKVFEGLAVLGYSMTPVPQGTLAYLTTADGTIYVYELKEKVLLPVLGTSPEEQRGYLKYTQPTDEPRLTLITCWPLGDTAYRLVVWGPLLGETSQTIP